MKLFKFVAASGVLSRRKSQESIQSALITVNDVVILDPFIEIDHKKDIVRFDCLLYTSPSPRDRG